MLEAEFNTYADVDNAQRLASMPNQVVKRTQRGFGPIARRNHNLLERHGGAVAGGIIRWSPKPMHTLLIQNQTQVADLCRTVGVRRLDVFGSAVRADFDPQHSDLDFLVEFDELAPPAYSQAFFYLKSGLEALFKRPVDLLTPSSLANPFFRRRVAAECKNLYAS